MFEYAGVNDTPRIFDIIEALFETEGVTLLASDSQTEYAAPSSRPVRADRESSARGHRVFDDTAIERARGDLERLLSLRSRMGELENARVDDGSLSTIPALATVLPGGAMQPGGVYSVQGAASLVMALLAGPSAEGAWCAVVGMPGFGAEAAARLGVDLDRLVLVPSPGDRWFSVTAALADAVSVVAVAPQSRVGDAEAARLAARLRQRRAVLIVCGAWPRVDARLGVASSRWSGVGDGHGYLNARELTVVAESRSWGRERTARLVLTADGRLQAEPAPAPRAGLPALKAVG
jgi:hypothetical protein